MHKNPILNLNKQVSSKPVITEHTCVLMTVKIVVEIQHNSDDLHSIPGAVIIKQMLSIGRDWEGEIITHDQCRPLWQSTAWQRSINCSNHRARGSVALY